MTKGALIQQLGEAGLLLPELINEGLAANDRLKYYLTLLQAAEAHALQPDRVAPTLRVERETSGVADATLDDVVAGCRLAGAGVLALAGGRAIRAAIFEDLERMLAPLETQGNADGLVRDCRERLRALDAEVGGWSNDEVPIGDVEVMTRPGGARDTVHQLVMDLHREINGLQAAVARESIDGAKAYGLEGADRDLVRAFMKGVNETAPLKFDHPGLGTTATRTADRLCIQNDLGSTDVHVVVVKITGLTATIVYSDLHRRRATFFRQMLASWKVVWQDASAPAGAEYELSVGVHTAPDRGALERYLAYLGSRLVFVIDWNKARKRLSRFVKRSDAAAVLLWAAENNIGHRAFLEVGDIALVYGALERGARAQLRYGMRLDELLGADAARSFLCAALRIASEGLRAGHTRRLIQDEIEAELLSHLQTSDRSTLAIAAEHAGLLTSLADRLRRTLARARRHNAREDAVRTAELAKAWETRADELVIGFHRAQDRTSGEVLGRLLPEADHVADALEEGAFLLTLIPADVDANGLVALGVLADLVSRSAREYVRCLEFARELPREPARADVEDVLVSVDRILQLEDEADGAERAAKAQLIQLSSDFRQLHVLSEIAQALETAADALGRCSLIVRDYALRGGLVTP